MIEVDINCAHVCWFEGLKFPDSYRGLLYADFLEDSLRQFAASNALSCLENRSLPLVIEPFLQALIEEADRIILPLVAHEVSIANRELRLSGYTPQDRYISFFSINNNYTEALQSLPDRYPYAFEALEQWLSEGLNGLEQCLRRFEVDRDAICQAFGKLGNEQIASVEAPNGGDRHRGQQVLVLTFTNGEKLVYKPTSLMPNDLLNQYVAGLQLELPYNQKVPVSLDRGAYGWQEYIHNLPCRSSEELAHYFSRAGALLAIADSLNYFDGHFDNLIASGEFPVLIDCETLFQNYSAPWSQPKDLYLTMFIQKAVTADSNVGWYAGLQTPSESRLEVAYPFVEVDRTDELVVKYRGIVTSRGVHNPKCGDIAYHAHDFVEEFVRGYEYGFEAISKRGLEIITDESWREQACIAPCRSVLRDTLAYVVLQRKAQQPEHLVSRLRNKKFLEKTLKNSMFSEYEVQDLLALNIPYFYHYPGSRMLMDGQDKQYHSIYQQSGYDMLTADFCKRSRLRLNADVDILRKEFNASRKSFAYG
ncbi:MAG: DUF4135 domain-containing protein [Candidatus Obscuribacterales bacterium]